MRIIENWNENWRFAKKNWKDVDPEDTLADGEAVMLPHTWYKDGDYYRGDAVYQKICIPNVGMDRRIFLQFHGVDKICRVMLNGLLVGEHQGGYSKFAVELTPYLKNGEENKITVLVNNENGSTVCPLSGDFTIFGGIHREVRLIQTQATCFDCTYYGTEGLILRPGINAEGVGEIYVQPHVCGPKSDAAQITYTVLDAANCPVTTVTAAAGREVLMTVENPKLWNGRQDPYMYKVHASLFVNDEQIDEIVLNTGFRNIYVDAEAGFFLNNKSLKLNGVAKHQDTAGVFSAATMEHWQKDMDLIDEIGANAVRLSHYQHPGQVYDLCDQKGFIVWAEIPLLKLTDNELLFNNARYQLTELIYQNMHHPSICFWGLQNEIAMFGEVPLMYDRIAQLQDYARELDPTRLTTSANLNSVADDSLLNKITDTVAYNLYFGWYYGEMEDFGSFADSFHKENPQIPLGISEYGVDSNINFHTNAPRLKDYTEEFQAEFHETVYPLLQERPFIWGTFIWNMFDFVSGIRNEGGTHFRNNKGLVTHDRKNRKDSFYYYKALWSKDPFVHIAEKRFEKRTDPWMTVKVYSNQAKVKLRIGKYAYEKASSQGGVFLFEKVPLDTGENHLEVSAGNLMDSAVFFRVEEPDPSYTYVDPNPGLNVRNWFEDEVEKERLFPKDAYSIMDVINTLLDNSDVMKIIDEMLPKVGSYMRETIGTFTLEQAVAFAKTLCNEKEVRELNRCLTKIKK